MGGHHLILGELIDFLTGKNIADTHDERYRQKIARFLVMEKGYPKEKIEPSRPLIAAADEKRGQIRIDFCVRPADNIAMVVKYGPGSLTTRHRPALAMARLVEGYQVPLVVVTNGEEAHLLDGASGGLLSQGLTSLPSWDELCGIAADAAFGRISDRQMEMEARIVYCYEIDGSCPCDDTVCKL